LARRPEGQKHGKAGANAKHLTLTGSRGHIFAYFITEVLNVQPASLQEFFLWTSGLSHLTGALCNAVTGREDGDMLLEHLERANLFLLACKVVCHPGEAAHLTRLERAACPAPGLSHGAARRE
jgi:hypothetical protein